MARINGQGVTFGEWVLVQKAECRMGGLVVVAKADREFPRRGSPNDVRKWLSEMRADGDIHSVVDDAESAWLGY